jgi:hypothetical protein
MVTFMLQGGRYHVRLGGCGRCWTHLSRGRGHRTQQSCQSPQIQSEDTQREGIGHQIKAAQLYLTPSAMLLEVGEVGLDELSHPLAEGVAGVPGGAVPNLRSSIGEGYSAIRLVLPT